MWSDFSCMLLRLCSSDLFANQNFIELVPFETLLLDVGINTISSPFSPNVFTLNLLTYHFPSVRLQKAK